MIKHAQESSSLKELIRSLHYPILNSCMEKFRISAMNLVSMNPNADTYTLLHILSRNNKQGKFDSDITKLVQFNASTLNHQDLEGRTALQYLMDEYIRSQQLKYSETFLWTVLYISHDDFIHSAMLLAKLGADVTLPSTKYAHNTLLHMLLFRPFNSATLIELIHLNPTLINLKNNRGESPLHALLSSRPNITHDMINLLLSNENLYFVTYNNETLLHAACLTGNLLAVEILNYKGLTVTALNHTHQTLLHYAVQSQNTDLCQWLIDHQVDINAKDAFGQTALHLAAEINNSLMVTWLLQHGANTTIKDNNSMRAMHLTIQQGYCETTRLLFHPQKSLLHQIQTMHAYGLSLINTGSSKAQEVIHLSQQLTELADNFFKNNPKLIGFSDFEETFLELLNSKNNEMRAYRISWETIVKNIAIALTGIGLILITAKLAHSKITTGRALFFFQKPQTTCEDKISDIRHCLDTIELSLQSRI